MLRLRLTRTKYSFKFIVSSFKKTGQFFHHLSYFEKEIKDNLYCFDIINDSNKHFFAEFQLLKPEQ